MACPANIYSFPLCSAISNTCFSVSACALDGVCDVEDELHVHGSLGDTGAPAMDDGDQSAVQLVHVALREEPAPAARLVLHLRGAQGDI